VTAGFQQTCEGDHQQCDAEFKNQDSFRDRTVERYGSPGICEDQNTFIKKCKKVRLQSNHETAKKKEAYSKG